MKYQIGDEVIFKYINYPNETYISKGEIVAYSESINFNNHGHNQLIPTSPSGASYNGSANQVSAIGPGYVIFTRQKITYTVAESNITEVMKKEIFKKELNQLLTD